jgi:hypothetical protein
MMERFWAGLLIGLAALAAGCATGGPTSQKAWHGQAGPVAWQITDIGQVNSRDGQRTRWSYVILLRETAGLPIRFERVERASYASGIDIIGGMPETFPFSRTLEPNSEIRLAYSESWGWAANTPQFGGTAAIQPLIIEYRFVGQDANARPVSVPLRLRLDRSLGKPVTPPPATEALPPARRLGEEGLGSLAGTWRGSYRPDPGEFDVPLTFVIDRDGSIEVAENDPVTSRYRGTVSLRDGKLAYTEGRNAGDLTLHETGDTRILAGAVSGPRPFVVRLQWDSRRP